jgi:hypothetical protein
MIRGDTRQWSFTVTDALGSAVSLASTAMTFTGKRFVSDVDASAIFQKVLAAGVASVNGLIIASSSLGFGFVQLNPIDTSGLEAAIVQLSYDIQMVDVNANKYTVAAGKLTVRPDVTLS